MARNAENTRYSRFQETRPQSASLKIHLVRILRTSRSDRVIATSSCGERAIRVKKKVLPAVKTRTRISTSHTIYPRGRLLAYFDFRYEVHVPISIAAGSLRSLVVPMSHQRHVERSRSPFRLCASTTGT